MHHIKGTVFILLIALFASQSQQYDLISRKCSKYKSLHVPHLPAPPIDSTSGVAKIFAALESDKVSVIHRSGKPKCYEWTCRSARRKGQLCRYCLPYFFVAGFSKCGTTALCSKLSTHPDIKPYRKKEINIFTKFFDEFSWLELEKRVNDTHPEVTGDYWMDCTAGAFRDYNAAAHLRKYSPETKLIFVVRDPWQRLGSWLSMNQRQQPKDKLSRFQYNWQSILRQTKPPRHSRFDSSVVSNLSNTKYVGSFLYAEVLLNWQALFPESNMLVVDNHELEFNPFVTMRRIESFLGLPHYNYEKDTLTSVSVNAQRNVNILSSDVLYGQSNDSSIHKPYTITNKFMLTRTRYLFWPSLCLFREMFGWAIKIITESESKS